MISTSARMTEVFEFRTRLAPTMGAAYVEFHGAIPSDLHDVMMSAGVHEWRIYIRRDILTHRVVADSREKLRTILDPHPVNIAWQRQVEPYLLRGHEPPAPDRAGALVWDFSWPTR